MWSILLFIQSFTWLCSIPHSLCYRIYSAPHFFDTFVFNLSFLLATNLNVHSFYVRPVFSFSISFSMGIFSFYTLFARGLNSVPSHCVSFGACIQLPINLSENLVLSLCILLETGLHSTSTILFATGLKPSSSFSFFLMPFPGVGIRLQISFFILVVTDLQSASHFVCDRPAFSFILL